MTSYLVTIQQQVYVSAESEESALRVVRENSPHVDVTGFHRERGVYSARSLKKLEVIECAPAKKPEKRHFTGNY